MVGGARSISASRSSAVVSGSITSTGPGGSRKVTTSATASVTVVSVSSLASGAATVVSTVGRKSLSSTIGATTSISGSSILTSGWTTFNSGLGWGWGWDRCLIRTGGAFSVGLS